MLAQSPPLILHVLHALHIGGMENGLVNLVNHLPATAFRHLIVCVEDFSPAFRARIQRPDVEVMALHRSQIGVWALRRALYALCRKRRPALVHSRNLSGLDAVLPARLAGVPCVHSEHGWDIDNLQGRAFKPLAILSSLGCLFLLVIGVQPPNQQALPILIGSGALLLVIWFGFERRRFKGPPGGRLR